jgi:hypothetical protein
LRRNCLLQRVIEGKIKGEIVVIGRWGRRRRNLLDDLKERRIYCHLKEEALDRSMWRARFGKGFGPVVRQTAKWMNEVTYAVLLYRQVRLQTLKSVVTNPEMAFGCNQQSTTVLCSIYQTVNVFYLLWRPWPNCYELRVDVQDYS